MSNNLYCNNYSQHDLQRNKSKVHYSAGICNEAVQCNRNTAFHDMIKIHSPIQEELED